MASKKNNPPSILHTWKEIAAHLGCDERTCRRWESDFGLPVRRLSDAPRSRVYARKEEIDAWLETRLATRPFADDGAGAAQPEGLPDRTAEKTADQIPCKVKQWKRRFRIPAVGAALALAAGFLFFGLPEKRVPADYRVEGSSIVIFDVAGREIWRYETGLPDSLIPSLLGPGSTTRIIGKDEKAYLPHLLIRDIYGDGRPEVLFYPFDIEGRSAGGLYCFNAGGRLLWRYDPGRLIRFGPQTYGPDFQGRMAVFDLNDDGRKTIVVVAHADWYFPSVVSLLDTKGRLLGEYWNSGHIVDVAAADLNGDGRKEILLAGINNEYRTAFLAVLDPDELGGASPQQNPFYTSPELGPGKEMFYIRFPQSAIDRAWSGGGYAQSILVNPAAETLILTLEPSRIHYVVNFRMDDIFPRITHDFEAAYRDHVIEGKITAPFDGDRITAELARGILWWDGEDWSPQPTMTKYWRDKVKAKPVGVGWPEI